MTTCTKCTKPTVGKSQYCKEHRAESRRLWKERIQQQATEKAAREALFQQAWDAAVEAGLAAGEKACPPLYSIKDTLSGKVYADPIELCGFGWVNVRPGNCAFANWLKREGHARKAYGGGVDIWIGAHGQSHDRKQAHARAMASVLANMVDGATFYAQSRLD